MSNYTLLNNATTVGALPPSPIIRPVPVDEQNGLPLQSGDLMNPALKITPPGPQAFQLVVTGTGVISASAQVYGCNDAKHWVAIGNPITATGSNTATAGGYGSVGYAFFGAVLTAISGTSAAATMTMNA